MSSQPRRPLIAGNWKMNKTGVEAREHVARLRAHLGDGDLAAEVAVCPPFTALEATARAASGSAVKVLAQAVHEAEKGAHTGEISAGMIWPRARPARSWATRSAGPRARPTTRSPPVWRRRSTPA